MKIQCLGCRLVLYDLVRGGRALHDEINERCHSQVLALRRDAGEVAQEWRHRSLDLLAWYTSAISSTKRLRDWGVGKALINFSVVLLEIVWTLRWKTPNMDVRR